MPAFVGEKMFSFEILFKSSEQIKSDVVFRENGCLGLAGEESSHSRGRRIAVIEVSLTMRQQCSAPSSTPVERLLQLLELSCMVLAVGEVESSFKWFIVFKRLV